MMFTEERRAPEAHGDRAPGPEAVRVALIVADLQATAERARATGLVCRATLRGVPGGVLDEIAGTFGLGGTVTVQTTPAGRTRTLAFGAVDIVSAPSWEVPA